MQDPRHPDHPLEGVPGDSPASAMLAETRLTFSRPLYAGRVRRLLLDSPSRLPIYMSGVALFGRAV